jgi:hypothetical protein
MIKILRPVCGCVGHYTLGCIDIGHCCIDDCKANKARKIELARFEEFGLCLTKHISAGDKAFVGISSFENGTTRSYECIVRAEELPKATGACFRLHIERVLSGAARLPITPMAHVWVQSIVPPWYFTFEDQRTILTSDGAIELQEGNFLGVKDGALCELSPNEVLALISNESVENSPKFSHLRLTPVEHRPTSPRKGMMILNNNTNKIEYYNGAQWEQI